MVRTMVSRVITTVGVAFTVTMPLANAQGGDMDIEIIMEELTEAIELSDEQAQEVAGHLQALGMAMAEVSEQAEAEDADGAATISALKATGRLIPICLIGWRRNSFAAAGTSNTCSV